MLARDKEYVCPGERHPISRAIHVARLAASFPACRNCPLRDDVRQLAPRRPVEPPRQADVSPRRDLFVAEGVRGVHLNELTRPMADTLAAAFAALLWDESAVSGRNDGIDRGARQVRPTVVAAYDERLSSPAMFSAVVGSLRRMGCHVIDIGLATKPCFWFGVDHLHASGGVLVTGAGCEPSWTGMDFVTARARPVSWPPPLDRSPWKVAGSNDGNLAETKLESAIPPKAGLQRLRELSQRPVSRPTRTAGTHRTFRASVPYEASVGKLFDRDTLGPLKVACASPSGLVRRTVERVFAPLPAQLLAIDLPVRVRNPVHRRDADMLRLSAAVREAEANLGILIDDDGQRCGFIDERGRHVSATAIARLVVPPLLAESPGSTVFLEPGAFGDMRPLVEALGSVCEPCPASFSEIAEALNRQSALYAGGDSGRHWFMEGFPSNDAFLILGKVLAALSRVAAPFSELAAG